MNAISIFFQKPLDYVAVTNLQEKLVAARIRGDIPDVVLFLEHYTVITLGVRADMRHVLTPSEELEKKNIQLVRTKRGGDITWHGPGQLVLYPIIKLGEREADAHGYLHNLEEIAIRTASDFNVRAFRRSGMTGAWTQAGKLAAIGIRLKRWITFHGMSLNVNPDLSGFEKIIPCGLKGESVTSLAAVLGRNCPALPEVRERMAVHFSNVCARKLIPYSKNDDSCLKLQKYVKPFQSALRSKMTLNAR